MRQLDRPGLGPAPAKTHLTPAETEPSRKALGELGSRRAMGGAVAPEVGAQRLLPPHPPRAPRVPAAPAAAPAWTPARSRGPRRSLPCPQSGRALAPAQCTLAGCGSHAEPVRRGEWGGWHRRRRDGKPGIWRSGGIRGLWASGRRLGPVRTLGPRLTPQEPSENWPLGGAARGRGARD